MAKQIAPRDPNGKTPQKNKKKYDRKQVKKVKHA